MFTLICTAEIIGLACGFCSSSEVKGELCMVRILAGSEGMLPLFLLLNSQTRSGLSCKLTANR